MRHTVICIGRESGSGGKVIGQEVAKRLGIEFYDSNLLEMAKEYGGITSDSLDKSDEKATNQFYYKLLYEGNENVVQERPATEMLYQLQSDVIKKIARTHDCVIVGRCADYVLREIAGVTNVFIYADQEDRLRRAVESYGENPDDVREIVATYDKARQNYYNYHTGQKWGEFKNYNLAINSSYITEEEAANLIADYVQHRRYKDEQR